jgi:hypothetical protein
MCRIKETPVKVKRPAEDGQQDVAQQAMHRQAAQQSLVRLHQRLHASGSVATNPFLCESVPKGPPLQLDYAQPARDTLSVLDAQQQQGARSSGDRSTWYLP